MTKQYDTNNLLATAEAFCCFHGSEIRVLTLSLDARTSMRQALLMSGVINVCNDDDCKCTEKLFADVCAGWEVAEVTIGRRGGL